MKKFTKQSIEQAIQNISKHPDLIKGRESKDYDVLLDNGQTYPPILVLSEANKILGGEELVIHDFRNNTRVPFRILRDLGFKVVKKKTKSVVVEEAFNYEKFIEACRLSNLIITDELAIRFIAALITKPFVILTGLSGSGKTKLALSFAKWIAGGNFGNSNNTFSVGEIVNSNRVAYEVTASDSVAVTFTQPETGTKATLPYELINDWIKVIKENNFTPETPTRKIREAAETITKYSLQLNSFETHLKAAAFQLIAKGAKDEDSLEDSSSVCLVPVGADWTNREPLLGYPNALIAESYMVPENGALQLLIDAVNNPGQPYFLILDEMNLSHVERYLADFLSAMESKEPIFLHSGISNYNGVPPSVSLPDNLFIIGTVNIDETTYMFSPKVLDRANVIEFRVDEHEMERFLNNDTVMDFDKVSGDGKGMAADFLLKSRNHFQNSTKAEKVTDDLLEFFKELKLVGAEFGYRTAAEIIRFVSVCHQLNLNWSENQILDAAIMQKLLPKLHGSRRKLESTLESLAKLCLHDKALSADSLNPKKIIDFNNREAVKFPISLEKIRRMNIGLINNNFTSYAEA